MKYYTWFSSFYAFSLSMAKQAILECSHQGDCTEECRCWSKRMRRQLSQIPLEDRRSELRDTGGWEDLSEACEEEINTRLVWVVACDLKEREKIC